MKTLFANGCSWTAGGSLDHKYSKDELLHNITWPKHVSNLLGFDNVVNLAAGCGSNQRIFRTTLNWLLSQPKDILKNTIAVIQWTEPARYEYYAPIDTHPDEWVNDELGWALVKPSAIMSWNEKDAYTTSQLLARSEQRLRNYTLMEGIYRNITYFESLSSLFKSFNVEYYFWDISANYNNLPSPIDEFILTNYNWLENGKHTWEYDRISETDAHPNENGNKQIAEHIYSNIQRLNYYGNK